jgi:heat shock protein HslJ
MSHGPGRPLRGWPLALALSACATAAAPPLGPLPEGLAGSNWRAETVAGERVPDDVAVTIGFGAGGRIAGRSGCNRYTGEVRAAGDGRLEVGPVATTRMACPPEQARFEAAFLAALQGAERFRHDNSALVLESASGPPSRFLPFTPP